MSTIIDRQDGLSSSAAYKGPCRVATTANITLEGLQTVDGVLLAVDDRVLVRAQTDMAQNGIYVADTGNWRRARDFERTTDVVKGTRVTVTDGTEYASATFQLDTPNPVIIGGSGIIFILIDFLGGNTLANTTQLAAFNTDSNYAIVEGVGFFQWKDGDYSVQVAADTAEATYVGSDSVASTVGAWERVAPYLPDAVRERTFNFAEYRQWHSSDQLALEAVVTAAFDFADSSTKTATIDFNGCMIEVTRPLDIATLTGESTNGAVIVFQNGGFLAQASSDWTTVSQTKVGCSWTALSDTITVPNTTGLVVGMYIATVVNDGICRWSHIIEITDATHVKIATRTWKAGSGDLVFYDYKYVFNFSGMTSSGNKRFYNIKADLQGNCSFINMPSNGNNWIVSDLQILGVKNRFLTNWNTAGGGSIVKFCEARPYDSDPATRTAIGIITTDNDNKFLNNRIINFLHAQVMHGNGYTISGCHNWQGAGDASAIRSSAYVHTAPAVFATYTGNYIDNGGIEFTTENSGSTPTSIRQVTITGNIFTFSENAQEGSYAIELRPIIDGGGASINLNGFVVQNNIFRKLGTAISKIEASTETSGGLDKNGATDFVWANNGYVSVTKKTTSRPRITLTVAQANASADWTQDGTVVRDTYYPFDLRTQRVNAVVPGQRDGLMAAGGTTLTYQPWQTTIGYSVNPYTIHVRWGASVHGTALIETDCSN